MFRKLKKLLDSEDPHSECGDSLRLAHLAATALLLEVGYADHNMDEQETAAVLDIVRQVFEISESDINEFFSEAERKKHDSISLYEFTNIINREFDETQKYQLICQLWRVAFADGKLDHYEDHSIRKIAELIYVGHSEFIKAKLEVAASVK